MTLYDATDVHVLLMRATARAQEKLMYESKDAINREWTAKGFPRPDNGYDTSPDREELRKEIELEKKMADLERRVAEALKKETFRTPRGTHYDTGGVTPIDLIRDAKLNFMEGSVVKYVSRHRSKGGREDLEKAIDYLKMLIESEYPE